MCNAYGSECQYTSIVYRCEATEIHKYACLGKRGRDTVPSYICSGNRDATKCRGEKRDSCTWAVDESRTTTTYQPSEADVKKNKGKNLSCQDEGRHEMNVKCDFRAE